MFRVLQADLDNLQFIIIIGIVHGAAEVIERSTMVLIDHICYVLWRRKSASWGTFRTPRRERLMADIEKSFIGTNNFRTFWVNEVHVLLLSRAWSRY